ncbi:MAG: site-specific integrase [bacterium]
MNNTRYLNEKMKRRYFDWARGALGYSDKTMKVKESSMWKYEDFTKNQDYKRFNAEVAKGFKKWLDTNKNKTTGKPLDKSTQYHILRHVNHFFNWLSMQAGYKSKIKMDDVVYLRLSKADNKIATSSKMPKYPNLSYIQRMCGFSVENEIDNRDRALIAFTALSGMRDLAVISLPLGCFDPKTLLVEQLPSEGVKTKFSKIIPTTLFKFDKELIKYVLDWYRFLKEEKLFDNTNPFFPTTKIELESKTQHSFISKGISKEFWSNAGSMRKIFKARALQMGLEYYSPHRFRHFAISEANRHAVGAEQMKAISQNVGHERLSTTFSSYGAIDNYRVSDIISGMDFADKS